MLMMAPLKYDDYGVAIICPLEVEMSAMRYMLDEEHPKLPRKEGDSNRYIYGRIGVHNIVIGFLPEGFQGVGAAATVATDMKRTFPRANLRLLVGIGGGVPSGQNDIRLGDVVVSMPDKDHGGVVQYDMGKATASGFERKGFLEPPPTVWSTCLVEMKSDQRTMDSKIPVFVDKMVAKHPNLEVYRRPPPEKDILYNYFYKHPREEPTCRKCDRGQAVKRQPLRREKPKIFYGLIASGNQVVKDAATRDYISHDAGGVLCFEMEAAGLMNDFKCIVIRGISDYADSHKNNEWHAYGAAVAAGCAKELLSYIEPVTPSDSSLVSKNAHWTITRTVNTNFTGRANLITSVAETVSKALRDPSPEQQCRVVVSGMGGQGKSEVCLHVADRVRKSCWGVFWVDVGTAVSAEKDFRVIGDRLGMPGSTGDEVRQRLANSDQSWLLILDNADDAEFDYQEYFPTGSTGAIILTSRNKDCHVHETRSGVSLDGLDPEDAIKLLLKAAQIPENQRALYHQDAEATATVLLKGHPLAIIQAGAYIAQGHCSVAGYAQIFERQRKRLLTFQPKQARSRYGNVYATFEASAIALSFMPDEAGSDALELLSVFAMLASGPLPLSWFEFVWQGARSVSGSPNDYSEDDINNLNPWYISRLPALLNIDEPTWDSFRLKQALYTLEAYSLLTIDGAGDSASTSMHPLTHAWAKDRQQLIEQQKAWKKAGSMIAISGPGQGPWYSQRQSFRTHFAAFVSARQVVVPSGKPPTPVIGILFSCGHILDWLRLDKMLYELTQQLLTWTDPSAEATGGKWLSLYDLAGRSAISYGRTREAVTLLEKVVKIEQSTMSETHHSLLASQHELARAYKDNGQLLRAVQLLEHVVRLREKTLVEGHPSLLGSKHVLAMAYKDNGQLTQAMELLESVVATREQTLGEDHQDRLASQHELGRVCTELGKTSRAVALLEHVVNIREPTMVEDHPSLLASQHALAMAYHNNRQTEKAVALLEHVVRVEDNSLAEDHPSRLESQHALALAYKENGQKAQAIKLLEHVVKTEARILAEDHPNRIVSQQALAVLFWESGDSKTAIAMMEKVVKLSSQVLPKEHPHRVLYEWWLSHMKPIAQ